MYRHIIKGITHWHEHEIHEQISAVLGYNTWEIGIPRFCMSGESFDLLDLTLSFPSRDDYERCRDILNNVRQMSPD